MENLKSYWNILDKEFQFNNKKLRISFSNSNPVYGKRFCVYVQDLLVYDVTQFGSSCWDNWIYYNPKVEKDVLDVVKEKIILEKEAKKVQEERRLSKESAEKEKIKNILDNYLINSPLESMNYPELQKEPQPIEKPKAKGGFSCSSGKNRDLAHPKCQ